MSLLFYCLLTVDYFPPTSLNAVRKAVFTMTEMKRMSTLASLSPGAKDYSRNLQNGKGQAPACATSPFSSADSLDSQEAVIESERVFYNHDIDDDGKETQEVLSATGDFVFPHASSPSLSRCLSSTLFDLFPVFLLSHLLNAPFQFSKPAGGSERFRHSTVEMWEFCALDAVDRTKPLALNVSVNCSPLSGAA